MNASEWAAWYGAIIATLVLVWDIFKWKQRGVRLRLTLSPGTRPVGEVPNANAEKMYILVEVVNVGDKKTELTHLIGLLHKTHVDRFVRRKKGQKFLVVNPAFSTKFPIYLETGERWVGGIEQTEELQAISRSGLLYCGVLHSATRKPVVKRIVIEAKTIAAALP